MHYFPVLKAKQGEMQALKELSPRAKEAIWPILQVPPPNMTRPVAGSPAVLRPHTDDNVRSTVRRMSALAGQVYFLDTLPGQLTLRQLQLMVQTASGLPSPPLPVIDLAGSDDYLAAYRSHIGEPERYCLRLATEASVNRNIVRDIQAALRHYGLNPAHGILLLDIGDVSTTAANISVYAHNASTMFGLTARLQFEEQVLSSGAFPMGFPPTDPSWSPLTYARRDWLLWRLVSAQVPVSYSDYAVSNPSIAPMPSFSGSPKARYTSNNDFLIIKGVTVGSRPNTMSEQYHRISRILVALPIFSGLGFSWGDGRIDSCCDPTATSNGNLTTWVAINTNHHLEYVVTTLPTAPPLAAATLPVI